MMKYQEPEMDIIELEFIDTSAISENSAGDNIWTDEESMGGNENLTVGTP